MKTSRRLLLAAALLAAAPACAQPAAPDLAGAEWIVEDIGGRGVVDRARVSITFGAEGRAFGSGGCNRFTGGYTLDGASLRFGQMAGTMMACVPALGEQEQRFHAALAEVRGWRIENGLLHLANGAGATVIRASRGG
jgi:heat shock protein HslJ